MLLIFDHGIHDAQQFSHRRGDGDHSSIGGGHKTGTNLRALAWMMALGQSKGVPFDMNELKGYNRLGEFKYGINYDPPGPFKYTGDKYRKERTIYSGNLKP